MYSLLLSEKYEKRPACIYHVLEILYLGSTQNHATLQIKYISFLHFSFYVVKSRSKKKKDLINNFKLHTGFMNSLWVRRLDREVDLNSILLIWWKNIYMRCKINTNVTLIIHWFVDKKLCTFWNFSYLMKRKSELYNHWIIKYTLASCRIIIQKVYQNHYFSYFNIKITWDRKRCTLHI